MISFRYAEITTETHLKMGALLGSYMKCAEKNTPKERTQLKPTYKKTVNSAKVRIIRCNIIIACLTNNLQKVILFTECMHIVQVDIQAPQ